MVIGVDRKARRPALVAVWKSITWPKNGTIRTFFISVIRYIELCSEFVVHCLVMYYWTDAVW